MPLTQKHNSQLPHCRRDNQKQQVAQGRRVSCSGFPRRLNGHMHVKSIWMWTAVRLHLVKKTSLHSLPGTICYTKYYCSLSQILTSNYRLQFLEVLCEATGYSCCSYYWGKYHWHSLHATARSSTQESVFQNCGSLSSVQVLAYIHVQHLPQFGLSRKAHTEF